MLFYYHNDFHKIIFAKKMKVKLQVFIIKRPVSLCSTMTCAWSPSRPSTVQEGIHIKQNTWRIKRSDGFTSRSVTNLLNYWSSFEFNSFLWKISNKLANTILKTCNYSLYLVTSQLFGQLMIAACPTCCTSTKARIACIIVIVVTT